MTKTCAHCSKPIPREANYARKKYCSIPCYWEAWRAARPARFWAKVEKGPGCWLWTGLKDKSGYGRSNKQGPFVYAHRIAWMLTNGPVPAGMDVLHTCDVRNCCNPAHLWLGTHRENMMDMHVKGRGNTKLTADQVREIKAALAGIEGKAPSGTYVRLAAKYGVSDKQIWTIRTGRQWSNVTAESSGDGGSVAK